MKKIVYAWCLRVSCFLCLILLLSQLQSVTEARFSTSEQVRGNISMAPLFPRETDALVKEMTISLDNANSLISEANELELPLSVEEIDIKLQLLQELSSQIDSELRIIEEKQKVLVVYSSEVRNMPYINEALKKSTSLFNQASTIDNEHIHSRIIEFQQMKEHQESISTTSEKSIQDIEKDEKLELDSITK